MHPSNPSSTHVNPALTRTRTRINPYPLATGTGFGGYATPNHDGKLLLVSNLKDGIDKYRFPSMEKVLPLWNLIVAGGDDSFARVFNQISGQLVCKIHHGAHGQQIQVVKAFADSGNWCIVVTASSG
ncbi:hypothetical protein EDB84DRAFT_1444900 [Lactarius hengduanensis]|nr:hypothetical protein EDB84DRAFT_1444900 [Lactarius hengduanensis]